MKKPENWTLTIAFVDILKNLKPIGENRWESLTRINEVWFRLRARMITPTTARVWIWPVWGDTSIGKAMLPRGGYVVRSQGDGPKVEVVLTEAGDTILHGQGRAVREFSIDFASGEVVDDYAHWTNSNQYCPRNPNQTGGNWLYMGIDHVGIAPDRLYQLGGYGGYFQKSDGSWLTQEDRPNLQASAHIHEHSEDRGWINYTVPSAPWMDRMTTFSNNQDAQHLCLFSPLADTLIANPHNEGLRMLAEAAVHVVRRLVPVEERGTTHDNPQNERAQGRVLKTCSDLADALFTVGEDDLSHKIGGLAIDRWEIERNAYLSRSRETGIGFATWGEDGYYSTNEIGIHFWGVWKFRRLLIKRGIAATETLLDELNYWMEQAAKWCFEQFRFYDIAGDRRWAYPYWTDPDDSFNEGGPVSSAHFAWFAAMHYEPQNPTEQAKHDEIAKLGEGYAPRFTLGLA